MNPARRWPYVVALSLTLARAPLVFFFLAIVIFAPQPPGAAWFGGAFAALALAAATDLVDGAFARRFNVTSRLGAYADPLTDKIYYLTAFPALVYLAARQGQHGHAALLLILTVLFLLRDQWVSFLRAIGALHGAEAQANWSGKARTLIAFPTICVVYYYLQAPAAWTPQIPAAAVYVLEAVSLALNVISIGVYTAQYWPWLKQELRPPEAPPLQPQKPTAKSKSRRDD